MVIKNKKQIRAIIHGPQVSSPWKTTSLKISQFSGAYL